MFCTNCGQENSSDARFCFKCGASIERPQDPTTPLPRATPSTSPAGADEAPASSGATTSFEASWYSFGGPAVTGFGIPAWLKTAATSGWKPAVQAAISVGAVLFALGFPIASLVRAASGDEWTEVSLVLPFYKFAGMLAYVLARMPLQVDGSFEFLVPVSGSMSMVFSLVLGFAFVAAALYLAGRGVAIRNRVTDVRGAVVEGIRVGIAFAGVALVGSLFFAVAGDSFTAGPDPSGSLWRAFVYATVFASLGATRTVKGRLPSGWVTGGPEKYRLWAHGASGALTGVRYGLLLSLAAAAGAGVVAYLLNAPDTEENLAKGLVATVIYLPNLVISALLLSHGATYEITGQTLGLPPAGIRLNYFSVPDFESVDLAYMTAPWWAFLLLVVPITAVWLAGYSAAARARITSMEDANRLSMRVGLAYGIILWALASLESSTLRGEAIVDLESISGTASMGISRLGAFFIPFIWGAAGTWLASRRYLVSVGVDPKARGAHRARSSRSPGGPAPTDMTADTAVQEPTVVTCANCGNANALDYRYCRSCGTSLQSDRTEEQ